jgi:hypothetical protein
VIREIVATTEGELLVGEAWHKRVDQLELAICEHPNVVDLEIEHRFTPGLYIRTLRADPGILATTYIHKQEHPFVVTKGVVDVLTDESKWVRVEAPHIGITKVGTRRVCVVWEKAEWTTFHPIPEGMTDIDEIERYIFDYRTLDDGTNVKDRFQAALTRKALASEEDRPCLEG